MKLYRYLNQPDVHRQVWRLAGPIMLSNLTVPLLGIVDTAVMGHLPDARYMGAVALGSMIFGIIFWGFGFLRMSTTGLTAQAQGANNPEEIRAIMARALWLACVFSVLLLVLQLPISHLAFYLIEAEAAVEQAGQDYFFIRILSAPASLANYVILGWFLGMQNARVPLLLLLVVNATNMLLDVVFVLHLGMTVDGVAWASVIAEYIGLLLGVVLIRYPLARYPGRWQLGLILNKEKLLSLFSLNRDIFIRTLCLMLTLAFFTAQGARFGELTLAANAVLFQLHTFMAYGLDGLSHAVEALVGKAAGKQDKSEFIANCLTAGLWALLMSLLFAVSYLSFGDVFVAWITDIEAVREMANHYIIWIAIMPLAAVWGFLFDGIYLGATRGKEMRNSMLFSTFIIFLPAWYLLQPYENHGLWLAFILFMLGRAVSMAWIFNQLQRTDAFLKIG